jgi:hypothetical protein
MAIAALCCALVTSAPAHAAKLAFVTDREGDREIYLMDDTGGGLVNLTADGYRFALHVRRA